MCPAFMFEKCGRFREHKKLVKFLKVAMYFDKVVGAKDLVINVSTRFSSSAVVGTTKPVLAIRSSRKHEGEKGRPVGEIICHIKC